MCSISNASQPSYNLKTFVVTPQEEERERRMDFVPEESAVNTDLIEVLAIHTPPPTHTHPHAHNHMGLISDLRSFLGATWDSSSPCQTEGAIVVSILSQLPAAGPTLLWGLRTRTE